MSKHFVTMTIDDAEHISAEQRQVIIDSYPPHEREARTRGIPSQGSGVVFPIPESEILCEPLATIPDFWVRLGGIDFGWDHPTAAVELAWDRDADCIYVIKAYKKTEATPIIHAAALKPWGSELHFSWPHDGLQHDKGSGVQLAELYRRQGLKLLPDRATFDDGSNGVEAGLFEILDRMQTGRWKVFNHLTEWIEEFRDYHRKDGKIVKKYDDCIDASRYAMMMLRFARTATPTKYKRPDNNGKFY